MFDKGPEQVERRPSALFSNRSGGVLSGGVGGCLQAAEDGDEPGGHRNYISAALQTGLCDWSAKYFAQPVMKVALLLLLLDSSVMYR